MVHIPSSHDRFAFTPAAPRARRDGWTAAAQKGFIAALADGNSVTTAARSVGRSARSAHLLRQRDDAVGFAAAWDAAVADSGVFATLCAVDRCADGTVVPILYRGRIIGERIVHDDPFLMTILRRTAPRPADAAAAGLYEREQRALFNYLGSEPGERFT